MRTRMGFLLCFLVSSTVFALRPNLIRGRAVAEKEFEEVVKIGGCTATIVGPQVIITAAHCGNTGRKVSFLYKGRNYRAVLTRSPLHGKTWHDISLGLVSEEIDKAKPMTIGGEVTEGAEIQLLGYGCTQPGGGFRSDDKKKGRILRFGKTAITQLRKFEFVTKLSGGSALCPGDSGGPAFVKKDKDLLLVGINSKGNFRDTNYNARLDAEESIDFLEKFADKNDVDICGITKDC